jgi:CRP/FNR family cyclic AMP-dependent transcriptional regulator
MNPPNSEYLRTLRRLPLFNDLSDMDLALVAEGVSRLHFDAGSVIFEEGNPCRELLIVEEGEVKLVKSALNGRQQLLSIERKGSSLAEVAVFDGGRYPATAEAVSSTTLLRLSADKFQRTCVSNPEMALKLFKVLAHRLRHLVSLVEELSFSTVRARLVAHLVRLAEQGGVPTPQGICFQLSENNEQLAARLGTVRELISRNLGRLHGNKLIEMNKRIVTIPNLALLRDEIERGN